MQNVWKYLLVLSLPALAAIAFMNDGVWTFLPVIEAFVLIPLLEYALPEDHSNLSEALRIKLSESKIFDFILYLMVPVQWGMMIWFLYGMVHDDLTATAMTGRVLSMGVLCGVIGINVAHELGHRPKRSEQWMAWSLLLSSLYMHFFLEHNFGHHKTVGTYDDPDTARKGESVYAFWLRSVFQGYLVAADIERKRLKREKRSYWSLENRFLLFLLFQSCLLVVISIVFGTVGLLSFLGAAVIGILLLETVNYIEHYGLMRNRVSEHRYENVEARHSWNADFPIGRAVLFELTRHSDHHYHPDRKYQLLESLSEASQLPAGYPAMMLCSLVPPLWFKMMDPRIPA